MTTAADILNDASLFAGMGDQYNAQDGTTSTMHLRILNDIIDEWGTDDCMIYDQIEGTFSLVTNQAQYQLGPGQSLNVTPTIIEAVSIYDSMGISYPVTLIGPRQFAQIAFRAATGRPRWAYIEWAFPNVLINFYPTPSFSTDTAHVWYDGALVPFAAMNSTLSMPAGYSMVFKTQLALRMCVIHKLDTPPDLYRLANEAFVRAQAPHKRIQTLNTDIPIGMGDRWRFNIYSGEWQ
jgi:hypothetical protein